MSKTTALIVAAGRSLRMTGDVPKQYRQLAGRMVLRHTLRVFENHPAVDQVVTVIHPDDEGLYSEAARGMNLAPAVHGGATRQDSVRHGLEALSGTGEPVRVLIHDGARPFVSDNLIDRVIDALEIHDAVIPALDVHDTLKRVDDARVGETVDRNNLIRAQTPQGFSFRVILEAHRNCAGKSLTDDAAVAEASGVHVATVPGAEENFKITQDEDLRRAENIIGRDRETCVGTGFDVHRFEAGKHVRLGGVDIPHGRALAGHSDADVALHALTDALLGAMGDGDIGSHFPPSDPKWKNADSAQFLEHAVARLEAIDGRLIHADLTVICEAPRIGPHRDAMRKRIADILRTTESRISVKATTTEGLGFTGRAEGIAAQAAVTISLPLR